MSAIPFPTGQRIAGLLFLAFYFLTDVAHLSSASAGTSPLDQWIVRTNLPANLRSVAFGNGRYVAVGSALWTSPNARQWTDHSLGTNTFLMSVVFGNGTFVIVSVDGLIFTSTDGVNWTRRDAGTKSPLWAVTFGNGRFVATGWGDGPSVVTTSTDGVNWKGQNLNTNAPVLCITYGNGQFVIPGYNAVVTSSDGNHWSALPSDFSSHGAGFGNGLFVATYWTQVLTSTDAINWSIHATPLTGGLNGISFSGTTFVAVSDDGSTVTSSVDGTNWVAHNTSLLPRDGLYGITYAEGRFTAVGYNAGTILQSGFLEPVPPVIVSNPSDRILKVGTPYTNRVTVESNLPVNYQWRVNGIDVPGATGDTFLVTQAPLSLSGEHSVVIANSAGSVTSSVAHVLVAEPTAVVVQPLSQTVPQGGTVTLSVTASGTPPIGFRWRRNGSTTNFMVLNSTQSFLTITNVQTTADYTVAITNAVSNPGVLSAVATITVLPDSDHDGLPDQWEQAHGLSPTDPLDAWLDSDGDGVSNFDEYVAGTDPRDPGSYLRIGRIAVASAVSLEFFAVSNKTYSVDYSDTLGGGIWNRLADLPARATSRTEVVLDPTPPVQRYYRLVTPRHP